MNKWTDEQVKCLQSLYHSKTAAEIAKIVGKSKIAVHVKANKMGLNKEQPCKIHLGEKEKLWLKLNYPHMSNEICALFLNISLSSVVRIAKSLGLSKTPQFMKESHAHTIAKAKESHIANGTYPPKGWYSPNLQKGKMYQFKKKYKQENEPHLQ